MANHVDDQDCFERLHELSTAVLSMSTKPILPDPSRVSHARSTLVEKLSKDGFGITKTTDHLLNDVTPALNASSLSPNYYGFVTGGVTPAARIAEGVVSLYDQNPLVHLPQQTVASNIEDKALRLLMDLLRLDQNAWSGVFTTGATASNVLGLACGREYIINKRLNSRLGPGSRDTVGSLGLLQACRSAGVENIHILTTMAHSSLYKAASIVGLGRSCINDVRTKEDGISFDFLKLEEGLISSQKDSVSLVVISCAEVNTGFFATSGYEDLQRLRKLCDKYGAWLHVDGGKCSSTCIPSAPTFDSHLVAFGIFGRLLDGTSEFEAIAKGCEGLEFADSIAGDGHKLLNVPYDCGFFFCRYSDTAQQVFQNPNAAYLNTKTPTTDSIQSPLNIGIENSRRFRGLPVYATLIAYGQDGYTHMLERQIRFARSVAAYIFDHDSFELLPKETFEKRDRVHESVFIIVLFRAKDRVLNESLVEKINASGKMYVSGTVWDGFTASRIAVSNWQVRPDRDIDIVKNVLEEVLERYTQQA